ncbi:ABC transporter permease [Arenibaculum pallidiluteum]|uniref:ABC transporter permease n=1 Tax=Arenibaculum pallidiluteum TaxID=2812559 RepID=UPI002E2AE02C|nr:iron ABC transporter permease [Arenibaculum pallidiluteum]
MRTPFTAVLAAGWLGFALLPWYMLEDGLLAFSWLGAYPDRDTAPALVQGLAHGRWWLLPPVAALLVPLIAARRPRGDRLAGTMMAAAGLFGLAWLLAQGFVIGARGWTQPWLTEAFGRIQARQFGMGWGALLTAAACLYVFTTGLARRGTMRGDAFVTGAIGTVIASILLFVFYPVSKVLLAAAVDEAGGFSTAELAARLTTGNIWGLACLGGRAQCGVLWNSLALAVTTGVLTTLLGLAFALLAERTGFGRRGKGVLKALTVLPVITPPFVIGLGIILIFGRNGTVTLLMEQAFGIPPSRWVYGFTGLVIVQVLAFTPIAYLVLVGVVQGMSPTLEEAAQMLRASRWRSFRTVTWPLMRPGLANAFLIGFVESLADFGNPLVLGGNFEVLSTQIFYAVVGGQTDPGRASALAIVLLCLTLGAFVVQRRWLGSRSYTTLSGKGDAGLPTPLPRRVRWLVYGSTVPWMAFTVALYALVLFGGFVRTFGIDNTLTLEHYATAFGIVWDAEGLQWTGRAWPSFFTTIELSAIAAPLTAAIGLLTAYLLNRQRFAGQGAFEFVTMLSFAIPGTVIGVSYILAFNVPPIELTGTGLILVICFVFRNMPVSIRAGIAAMTQIDKSLDECSLTLRHGSFATVRRVILPLLRPAVVASLVYSFVRAITSVSAVIFLVSAQYNLATAYIVGRVEVSDFGVAIAYSSALIVFMTAGVALIQLLVGERRLGRRNGAAPLAQRSVAA